MSDDLPLREQIGLLQWLARTAAIEVEHSEQAVAPDGKLIGMAHEYPFRIAITNGAQGAEAYGMMVARTSDEADAGLVAACLRIMQADLLRKAYDAGFRKGNGLDWGCEPEDFGDFDEWFLERMKELA